MAIDLGDAVQAVAAGIKKSLASSQGGITLGELGDILQVTLNANPDIRDTVIINTK